MAKYTVWLRAADGYRPALWVFVTAGSATFPEDFYRGFENGGTEEEVYDPQVVWIADQIQAMVAHDRLLEYGWEINREASDKRFLACLDGE